MSDASETYHEALEALRPETRDLHRALSSLREELEAIDWYGQRIDACADPGLAAILAHNMREEVEHACMLLEWLRRHQPDFGERLRTHLFLEGDIAAAAERAEHGPAAVPGPAPGPGPLRLTLGSLKEVR